MIYRPAESNGVFIGGVMTNVRNMRQIETFLFKC